MADTLTYKKWKHNDEVATDLIKRETRNGAADVAFIPFDDSNNDYIEYKAWLAAGNTPAASD